MLRHQLPDWLGIGSFLIPLVICGTTVQMEVFLMLLCSESASTDKIIPVLVFDAKKTLSVDP